MNDLKSEIQNEALEVLKDHKRAGVVMSMGLGKTLLGLLDMVNNYNEFSYFLVVAPKRSIFKSWIDDANKFGFGYLIDHIKFTTYLSLSKQSLNFQKVYLDECHNLLESHDSWLSRYNGDILGLTGTPPLYKDKERFDLVNKYCPVVYRKDVNFAVDNKILNDYKIYVHTLNLNPTLKHKFGKGYMTETDIYNFWTRKLFEVQNEAYPDQKLMQYYSIMRMKALQSFKSKTNYAISLLGKAKHKTIVFANTKKQADQICKDSYYSGKKNAEKNLENFKQGTIDKLSCVLQLNEGVNIPELRNAIILHAYGNNRKSSQRIGRLLRLNPDDKSFIHILCYRNTIDEKWVKDALDDFDASKIEYL
jgi:superfamily II DNA or RNA helicase